jgi:hypothetical protein
MTEFHDIQTITTEVDKALKVELMESLHWDFRFTRILFTQLLGFEGEIMLNWLSGKLCFVIFPRGHG